jgi:Na+-transporting methylmalonyl-CoA/oxaloacetate decarboxylase gamma subunit
MIEGKDIRPMRRSVILFATVVAIFWTLLSLGAYTLIGFAGGALVSVTDDAGTVGALLAALFALLKGLGLGIVVLVWALGVAAILGVSRLAARAAAPVDAMHEDMLRMQRRGPVWRPEDAPAARDGEITLEQGPDGTWGPPQPPRRDPQLP